MPPINNPLEVLLTLELQDSSVGGCIQEVILRVAQYHPVVQWQCTVRFRDATRPWAGWVDESPEIAFSKALGIALRGPGAAAEESKVLFYEKKDLASGMLELLQSEYPDRIAAGKVEFEPYRGWVIVLFPQHGTDLSDLRGQAEIRIPGAVNPPPQAPRTSSGAEAARLSAGHPLKEGRMSVTKDVLDNEYKMKKGKFPDRNIKKIDLAKLLDDMEAAGE